ncbi:diguanylate cyclase [Phormidium tenue FACHB-886]|nr:diguanylate cyclase [Phormidium tenue FACHB-886]
MPLPDRLTNLLSHLFANGLGKPLHRIRVGAVFWFLHPIKELYRSTPKPALPTSFVSQQQFLQQVIDIVPSSIYVKDREGRILAANQASAKIHGTTVEAMLGKRESDFNPYFTEKQLEQFLALNQHVMATGQPIQDSLQAIATATGELHWYQTIISPLIDADGEVLGVVGNSVDITVLKQIQEKLELLASTDGLTQVANRRRLDLYLQQEWQRLAREQQPLSFILFDIDYFKHYNDYYGHQQGDWCLIQIAQAVTQTVKRPADLLARYGGEEFAVVLPNTDTEGALTVAEQIRQTVQDLHLTYERSGIAGIVTISAGVASACPTNQETPELLLRKADDALYEAKRQGRNRVVLQRLAPR